MSGGSHAHVKKSTNRLSATLTFPKPLASHSEVMDDPLVVRITAHRTARSVSVSSFDVTTGVTAAEFATWRTTLDLVVRKSVDAVALEALLREEVDLMDRVASRFRADSEITAVNRGQGHWVRVSDYFLQVLEAALTAAELTDGLVDPCVGAFVDAAGYRHWRDGSPVPQAPSEGGCWRDVAVRADGLVRVPAGTQLDVGAVAKGWLADRLAKAAALRFGCDALANMGGDLRVVGEQAWVVAADPGMPGVEPQALELGDAGLATSSTGQRRWTTPDGKTGHHIIDPRTGRSADTVWTSCSVIAATAAQANAASTAGLILSAQGPTWLAEQGLDGWFVAADCQARVGRWPER